MYRCSEVVRLISSDEYSTAGLWQRVGIRLHLAVCKHCAAYLRQIRALAGVLRTSRHSVPAAEIESAKLRILQHLLDKS